MNIEIKKLSSSELHSFIELIRVFEDVFTMQNFKMPDEDYLQKLFSAAVGERDCRRRSPDRRPKRKR